MMQEAILCGNKLFFIDSIKNKSNRLATYVGIRLRLPGTLNTYLANVNILGTQLCTVAAVFLQLQ